MVQLTLRNWGAGVKATEAAATYTVTGMETDTPVPVRAMLPEYVPAALKDATVKDTDRLAGFDWFAVKLLAESPIHDWFALAVKETAAAEGVLN
jgi:hypothetical protein